MRVYLDDDLDSNALIGLLRQEGHEVVSPREVGTRGVSDEQHLQYAAAHALVLLANWQAFINMQAEWTNQQREHHGILLVYRENNAARDMTFRQISRAVTQIEQAGLPLPNACHNLNFWRRG